MGTDGGRPTRKFWAGFLNSCSLHKVGHAGIRRRNLTHLRNFSVLQGLSLVNRCLKSVRYFDLCDLRSSGFTSFLRHEYVPWERPIKDVYTLSKWSKLHLCSIVIGLESIQNVLNRSSIIEMFRCSCRNLSNRVSYSPINCIKYGRCRGSWNLCSHDLN